MKPEVSLASARTPSVVASCPICGHPNGMADLDCSSFESALETAAAVLGVAPGPLLERPCAFEYGVLPESEWRRYPYEDLLAQHVAGVDHYALRAPERITWFHATRVSPSVDYAEGLLPLLSVHEGIKTNLDRLRAALLPRAERQNVRSSWRSRGGRGYQEKLSSPFEKGPHAFLVRAVIFQPRALMNHDYLAISEIVEDICQGYGDEDGQAVYEYFLKSNTNRRHGDDGDEADLAAPRRPGPEGTGAPREGGDAPDREPSQRFLDRASASPGVFTEPEGTITT
jgi:hypothetical protein